MSADGAPYLKKGFQRIVEDLLADLASGQGGRVAITDSTPGSVLRTLVEAFGRELAVAYAELDHVYRLGYLETAEGDALDLVVALLGLARRRGGYVEGTVTFSRVTPAPDAISIPLGAAVSGRRVPLVETTVAASLPRGATEVTVPVVSAEPAAEPVPAGALDVLVQPLLGIEAVTNRVVLIPRAGAETDEELRARARRRVDGARVGTVAGLEAAVRGLGFAEVTVEEPVARLGVVEVTVGDDGFTDADRADVEAALERARPAGIVVSLAGVGWVELRIEAALQLARALEPPEQRAVERALAPHVLAYVAGLGVRESVRRARLEAVLTEHDAIAAVRAIEVTPYVDGAADTARISTAGDVLIGPRERARLAPEGLSLTLEPPAPVVWLDVLYRMQPGVTPDQAVTGAQIGEDIHAFLSGGEHATIAWRDLWNALSPARREVLLTLRVLLVHERDGLVAELEKVGDVDALDPAEDVRIRKIEREEVA